MIAFLRSLRHHLRGRLVVLVCLAVVAAAFEGLGLLALVPLLAAVGVVPGEASGWMGDLIRLVAPRGEGETSLAGPLALFVVLVTLRALVVHLRDRRQIEARTLFSMKLRLDLFQALGRARWSHVVTRSGAECLSLLTQEVNRVTVGVQFMLRAPAIAFMVIAQICVGLMVAPWMVLVAGGGALAIMAMMPIISARVLGARLSESHRLVMVMSSEFLDGLKIAKSQGLLERHLRLFAGRLKDLRALEVAQVRADALARMVFQIGAALFLALSVYLAHGVFAVPGGDILVMVAVLARLMPTLSELRVAARQVAHMLPAHEGVRRATEAFQRHAEPGWERGAAEAETQGEGDTGPVRLERALTLEGVGYRRPPPEGEGGGARGGRLALSAVDAEIPAGEMVALVGRSGAGKSTLADLVLGLLEPSEGKIRVDDRPLGPDWIGRWRRSIAYVPQETVLFDATVRENLLWAAPEASEADMRLALEQAAALSFVEALPQGLDTEIGERALRLSGGERQRLALARALLRRPTFLVLDEATSELDAIAQEEIRDALEALRGTMTLLVIAHRLSTVQAADQILVLDGGRLVERGRWAELSDRDGGMFRALLIADSPP